MREDESYIAALLMRHLRQELTPEEQEILGQWLAGSRENQDLKAMLQDDERFGQAFSRFLRIDSEQAWKQLQHQHPELKAKKKTLSFARLFWIAIFVGSLLVLGVGFLFSLSDPPVHAALTPPGNYATLQLTNGAKYELAKHPTGEPIDQNGCITICKCTDSTVVYHSKPGCVESYPPDYYPANNILSTPRGGRYGVVFEDKSQIRLNAASSLYFPTRFDSLRREVYLTGEAYFQVTPTLSEGRPEGPFVVHVGLPADTNRLNIVSLGARFDVRAYPGEGIVRVALDEGSLRLEKGEQILMLFAGHTAILNADGVLHLDDQLEAAGTSWIGKKFAFRRQPLAPILTELSRWYDARICYTDGQPAGTYTLEGSRNQPLNQLLTQLKSQGHFHYRLKADTVYIFKHI